MTIEKVMASRMYLFCDAKTMHTLIVKLRNLGFTGCSTGVPQNVRVKGQGFLSLNTRGRRCLGTSVYSREARLYYEAKRAEYVNPTEVLETLG